MLKKFLNHSSQSITGAAIIIAGANLLSRLTGLIRDRIFAHFFGAAPTMDAYYAAFKIPDLIFNLLIAGALAAGFIPIFSRLYQKDENQAWRLTSNVLNIGAIALILVAALGVLLSPLLIPLIAPGFDGSTTALTIAFTRVMMISPLLFGISLVMGGVLQSLKKFIIFSLAPIFYNFGIITGATALFKLMGPAGLAWGVILGALLHCLLQTWGAVSAGFKWQKIFVWRDPDTRQIGRLMLPRVFGAAASQINAIFITVLASLLGAGGVAVYNYANNLASLPTGVIGVSFAIAAFPALSGSALSDPAAFVGHLSATTRKVLFLIVPFGALFLLLRAQIVRVVLGTGQFDWTATISTADALAFFSLGLFAQALIPLFARAFYSLNNTKTPVIVALFAEAVTLLLAYLLMRSLGVAGLALAVSAGAALNLILLVAALRLKLPSIDGYNLLRSIYKISLATLIMMVAVQYLKYPLAQIFDLHYFWGIFGQGALAGVVGLMVYSLVCYIMKLEEFMAFIHSFKRRFLKISEVPVEVETETRN